MSQYPQQPYTPPPGYGSHPYYNSMWTDPRGPGKRAGVLMFVLAGIMMLCGACVGGMFSMIENIKPDQFPPQSRQQFEQAMAELQKSGISVGTFGRILGGVIFFPGLFMAILAPFVRRGGIVAIIVAIVLDVLMILLMVLQTLGSIVQIARAPESALGLCFTVIPLVLLILLLVWLIQAAKNAPQVRALQEQQNMQYWGYQQQQQMYQQQPGYGYPPGQMPPPPPPPSSGDPNDPSAQR